MKNEHDIPESEWMRSIVAAHAADLTRYAASILRSEDVAKDVVQETFVRLWREPRESVADHVRPWLFCVCRNRALDYRKKGGRMKPLENEHAAVVEETPGPQALAERQDSHARILHLMRALPENQQEVVRLKFQNGMSYKEIASVTELSVSNVGVLLHTALNTLRTRVAAAGE
ncbi:MAG: RNA polymerase sigma factor [Puniceicoccaceae bacterium]